MSSKALVSVLIPTYQAVETLPRAIASLFLQTYPHWEAIVVDDGSVDETRQFLHSLDDPRIRTIRHPRNLGRGSARNTALSHANGEFICSLDADDWFYQHKLESQINAFLDNPELVAVTVGMAVTDEDCDMIGAQGRATSTRLHTMKGPIELRFPFGPTMIRTDVAREVDYDCSLRRGCDVDFFIRLMCQGNRRLGHLPELSYVYRGHTSTSVAALLAGHRWSRAVYRKHLSRFPLDCTLLLLSSSFKSLVYSVADLLGIDNWVSRKRYLRPENDEIAQYCHEKTKLEGFLDGWKMGS